MLPIPSPPLAAFDLILFIALKVSVCVCVSLNVLGPRGGQLGVPLCLKKFKRVACCSIQAGPPQTHNVNIAKHTYVLPNVEFYVGFICACICGVLYVLNFNVFLQKMKYAIHISVWSNSKCFKSVIDVILSDSLITFY